MINSVFLVGGIGFHRPNQSQKDPSKKHLYFSVCISRLINGTESTKYHNCVIYNCNDWIISNIKKGDLVTVNGSLDYNESKEALIIVYKLILPRKDKSEENKENEIPF